MEGEDGKSPVTRPYVESLSYGMNVGCYVLVGQEYALAHGCRS